MAIVIEGFSVVVRCSTLAAKYPGGLEKYRRDCPNQTFCADEHLSRVGFMAQDDADRFVAKLAADGLMPTKNNQAEDAAVVGQVQGPLVPCPWLEIAPWGPVTIAWLAGSIPGDIHAPAGWNADKPVFQMTAREAMERLEFVRSDGNIDVYHDKKTGQELYTSRVEAKQDRDYERHNQLYKQACDLVEGLLVFDYEPAPPLTAASRERLENAITLFEQVIEINPGNWSAMWLMGKIQQRMGGHERALAWFSRAHRLKPDQPDVAREAAIALMDVGRPSEALVYCQRAIEAAPDDAGHRSNLAVALLFSGKPEDARVAAEESLRRGPGDPVTLQVLRIIKEVLAGTRQRPNHMRDLQGTPARPKKPWWQFWKSSP